MYFISKFALIFYLLIWVELPRDYIIKVLDFTIEYSNITDIEPELMIAIFMVESSLDNKAHNKSSHDFGIGQINDRTIKAYGFDKERIQNDLSYSIYCSFKVLKDFKKQFESKEPLTWYHHYNTGSSATKKEAKTYIDKICRFYIGSKYCN